MTDRPFRILFINPSSMPAPEQEALLDHSSILRVPSFSMPIGLLDLAAFLRARLAAVAVEILDVGKDLYLAFRDRERLPPMSLSVFLERELDTVRATPDWTSAPLRLSHDGDSQAA